ncbi:uncharacterized protein FOMMEDRAFT_136616 [Fomitiporia mediterranea MF3/22]|uniref:uncharacterized protein n=1 Tax=Fomitiporia mediterranea (strain MF3/22) TaxID=694068 RepID=UPI0004408F64|nr:uncharacterized protein FOMMEDRAFT_136616 [Fomitiporia mediterranea MF3/22]EJC99290.1 hypothetical protein FOMMEDRAFT_136616 [Fomitiporia mediterranea MF3/22]
MGQVNSCECAYHCLRTEHSEEGYCALCEKRFSNLRGKDREILKPDEKLVFKSKLDDHIAMDVGDSEPTSPACIAESSQGALRRLDSSHFSANPDAIYRCFHCAKFFYSAQELLTHVSRSAGDGLRAHWSSPTETDGFCGICRRSYSHGVSYHTNSAILHIQRPEISSRDIEIERACDCCVRCGIYFTSGNQKRKHFRDIEHHIMHMQQIGEDPEIEAFKTSLAAFTAYSLGFDECDTLDDSDYSSAGLFPLPPSTLPTPPKIISQRRPDPLASTSTPAIVSLRSAYAPELRVDPTKASLIAAAAQLHQTKHSKSSAIRRNPGHVRDKQRVTVSELFECPLCLENETDIASLPCGHVYGISCIIKTLESDPRCPLCRRPTERKMIRRVSPHASH